jgi:hypothetical protein
MRKDSKRNIIIFTILLIMEFALFRTYVLREIEDSCPRNIDQSVFMRMTYHMYENILNGNYGQVLSEIRSGLGQGAFPIFGLIALFLFGKSRLSLLMVNFILFIIAQIVGFYAVKKISNRDIIGYLYIGMFLMIQSTFMAAGDLVDYRMDFSGFCLYTCWFALFVAAYYTEDKKTYYLSAVFAGLCLMFRSNTLAYMCVAFAFFECLYVFVFKKIKFKNELINLLKYIGVVIVSGGWYILLELPSLFNYYITAHVTSDEPLIRMLEQGISNNVEYLLFYPRSLFNDHLGVKLKIFIIIIILGSIIIYFINRKKKNLKISKNEIIALVAGICAFLSPIIVLTIDVSKSSVVICTISGAAVILGIYFWTLSVNRNLINKYVVMTVTICAVGLGVLNYVDNTTKHHTGYDVTSQDEMLAINRCMEEYIIENDLDSGKLLVDRICDAITTDVLTLLTYEDYGKYVDMGYAWNEINTYVTYTKEEVDEALAEADIMVLSKNGYSTESYYKSDESYAKYREIMLGYAYDNMIQLGEFELGGDILVVFGKGQASVTSTWTDWMSDEGTKVKFKKMTDNQTQIIINGDIGGGFDESDDLTSEVILSEEIVPSTLSLENGRYIISIDISSLELGDYSMELKFNDYFIPSELGINSDTRKLVLMAPDNISVN